MEGNKREKKNQRQREYEKQTGNAASKKSQKKNTKLESIRLTFSTDGDIIEKLNSLDNKAGYLKKLIRDDIAKSNAAKED